MIIDKESLLAAIRDIQSDIASAQFKLVSIDGELRHTDTDAEATDRALGINDFAAYQKRRVEAKVEAHDAAIASTRRSLTRPRGRKPNCGKSSWKPCWEQS